MSKIDPMLSRRLKQGRGLEVLVGCNFKCRRLKRKLYRYQVEEPVEMPCDEMNRSLGR